MNVTVFIPNTAYIPDVLGFLHDAGRSVQGLRRYGDGVDITFGVARNEEGRILSKATARGFIVGGRVMRPQAADVIADYTLEELMGRSVKDIETFLGEHELGVEEYEDMLAYELAHKNRTTVVKGLKALV